MGGGGTEPEMTPEIVGRRTLYGGGGGTESEMPPKQRECAQCMYGCWGEGDEGWEQNPRGRLK
jgi:hypothetical protein